jgi:hypothetical protein
MDKFNSAQLKTKLTSIANATDHGNLQAVFVNVVYQSLVMGNNMPDHILAIRNSAAPQAFKAALGTYLPLKFSKAKGVYEYSRVRAEKLRTELGIELTSDERVMSVDEVAAVLPAIFDKPERQAKEFDIATYCKSVGTKLGNNGVANAELVSQILESLARNPEQAGRVADALLAGTFVKAA